MNAVERYSITTEMGVSYDKAVGQYILARFGMLTSGLLAEDCVSSPHTNPRDLKEFTRSIIKAAPIYLVEQLAPNAKSYNSLRGSGYSEMSLALAKKSIFNRGGIETVMLNHEFRASANALDAVVDESDDILSRYDLRHSSMADGFMKSKMSFFDMVRKSARTNQNEDMTPFGNTARRYQIHQDLYLDLARMKRHGLDETKYLKIVPKPQQGLLLSREQIAHLILMGLDGETLLVDSLVPVTQSFSCNPEARDAAFWAAVMGSLGDQWADVLQDLCSDSENMFISVLDNFPEVKELVMSQLSPIVRRGKELVGVTRLSSKLNFLRLQIKAHQIIRKTVPDTVEKYGRLITKSFNQIPEAYRDAFIPILLGAWDLVSLYQLSDFLLHKDEYENKARRS